SRARSAERTARPVRRVAASTAEIPVHEDPQEQPHDVDEVPVPGCRLEAEMVLRGEVPLDRAEQANREEDGADDDVEAVEAGRHVEGRRVDAAVEGEGRLVIFQRLERGE